MFAIVGDLVSIFPFFLPWHQPVRLHGLLPQQNGQVLPVDDVLELSNVDPTGLLKKFEKKGKFPLCRILWEINVSNYLEYLVVLPLRVGVPEELCYPVVLSEEDRVHA